jgi:hypothetical protein
MLNFIHGVYRLPTASVIGVSSTLLTLKHPDRHDRLHCLNRPPGLLEAPTTLAIGDRPDDLLRIGERPALGSSRLACSTRDRAWNRHSVLAG